MHAIYINYQFLSLIHIFKLLASYIEFHTWKFSTSIFREYNTQWGINLPNDTFYNKDTLSSLKAGY